MPEENFDDWVLPVGQKHRGEALKDIPVRYLDWMLSEDWVWQSTKDKIKAHLEQSRKSDWEELSR